MIGFKDMTFCPFLDCGEWNCHRRLTKEVRRQADNWWGEGEDNAPICMYVDKPECYNEEVSDE